MHTRMYIQIISIMYIEGYGFELNGNKEKEHIL
jgi:hypothetical protein